MTATAEGLTWRKYLKELLTPDGPRAPLAVVLVGSYATGGPIGPLSDLDVLVLEGDVPSRPPASVQVIPVRIDELRERVSRGDDFAQWALRFGRPLRGRSIWSELRDEILPSAPWPSSARKLEQASRRLRAAADLLEMGDVDAAQDEARYGLSHVARGLLLSREVFPRSRPELAAQLRAAGLDEVARALEAVYTVDPIDEVRLRDVIALGERWIAGSGSRRS
ncbi:MAG TPA: hypothetical protein VEM93_10420 [Actinomycetota bacterium]|nr:hypothetical protein [Actinomycetota bacterium]